jgi:hypothetical protein
MQITSGEVHSLKLQSGQGEAAQVNDLNVMIAAPLVPGHCPSPEDLKALG